jgi:hypothetical protein
MANGPKPMVPNPRGAVIPERVRSSLHLYRWALISKPEVLESFVSEFQCLRPAKLVAKLEARPLARFMRATGVTDERVAQKPAKNAPRNRRDTHDLYRSNCITSDPGNG